jgi:hypothetical protein
MVAEGVTVAADVELVEVTGVVIEVGNTTTAAAAPDTLVAATAAAATGSLGEGGGGGLLASVGLEEVMGGDGDDVAEFTVVVIV